MSVERTGKAVRQRGASRRAEPEKRSSRHEEACNTVGILRSEAHADPAAKRVPNDERCIGKLIEHWQQEPGVLPGADRLRGRRGGAKTREIHGQSTDRGQTVCKVAPAPPPTMEGKHARLPNTDCFGEQGAVHERTQSQNSNLDLRRQDAENTVETLRIRTP